MMMSTFAPSCTFCPTVVRQCLVVDWVLSLMSDSRGHPWVLQQNAGTGLIAEDVPGSFSKMLERDCNIWSEQQQWNFTWKLRLGLRGIVCKHMQKKKKKRAEKKRNVNITSVTMECYIFMNIALLFPLPSPQPFQAELPPNPPPTTLWKFHKKFTCIPMHFNIITLQSLYAIS